MKHREASNVIPVTCAHIRVVILNGLLTRGRIIHAGNGDNVTCFTMLHRIWVTY